MIPASPSAVEQIAPGPRLPLAPAAARQLALDADADAVILVEGWSDQDHGDPQASAASWAAWRRESDYQNHPSPTTTCLGGKAILSEGKQLASGFKHVVVDAGGRDSVGLRSALLLAQRAVIPVGASNLDAAAMTDLLEVVDMAKDYNPELDVRVLLTRVDPRTKDAQEMLSFLAEAKLTVLPTKVCERVAFRRAIGEGATVQELGKDPAATAEMAAFFKEVTA